MHSSYFHFNPLSYISHLKSYFCRQWKRLELESCLIPKTLGGTRTSPFLCSCETKLEQEVLFVQRFSKVSHRGSWKIYCIDTLHWSDNTTRWRLSRLLGASGVSMSTTGYMFYLSATDCKRFPVVMPGDLADTK